MMAGVWPASATRSEMSVSTGCLGAGVVEADAAQLERAAAAGAR